MHELGRPIDLARTTTGDGFYVWNREKGAQADFDIYLLTMFVLAGNAISQQEGRAEMVPELRTCFSVGPHYSYHQVDGLDPRGHDYIVGDVTILLARMAAKCLPGQILLGDFRRPNDAHQGDEPEPTSPLEFVLEAGEIFAKHGKVKLHGRTVTGIRCYLTGEPRHADQFDVTRFRIRDKHGFDHDVFNQKFNVYLSNVSASADTLYLGRQKSDLTEFDALEMETMPLVDVSLPLDRLCA
jgi:hypothetical protein